MPRTKELRENLLANLQAGGDWKQMKRDEIYDMIVMWYMNDVIIGTEGAMAMTEETNLDEGNEKMKIFIVCEGL